MTIFLEVAACNNMSTAAQNLYISQSTVSLAITEIEKTYNVRLFDRLSKHLRLTEAGLLLLDYASRIINLYKEMESALLGLHLKQIHIGSTLVAASFCRILSGRIILSVLMSAHVLPLMTLISWKKSWPRENWM